MERERGKEHHQHLGTLTGTSINHQKFFSSSISSSFIAWSWNNIIIIVHGLEMESETSTLVIIKL
jgi:hypothetical protein